ncbi:MAG: spore coat associated protein CotJA [Ruminococcus flavefaciens]|nr:spore coat associated protein CotJA [Ruminococcus flavefaciens]
MNLNLFDDMDGLILRERENSLDSQETFSSPVRPPQNSNMSRFPQNAPLAMAYVPFQEWGDVYTDDEAFPIGTLFPDLNFPFMRGADSNE